MLLSNLFFDYFSTFYGIIILIITFICIKKGFVSSLISFFGLTLVFVGAFLLAKPLGDYLYSSTGLGSMISNPLNDYLITKGNIFNNIINPDTIGNEIKIGLVEAGIPESFAPTITNIITPYLPDLGNETLGVILSNGVSKLTCIILSFIILFIVFSILLFIVKKLANKINDIAIIGWINRLGGGAIGLLISILIVCVISYFIQMLSGFIPSFNTLLHDHLKLNDPEAWSFAKFLYEQNFINKLITLYLK